MSAGAETTPVLGVEPEALSRYFRVLGDPTRLRIIEALLERERTVSELVDHLGAPQSRVSYHLACRRWCRVSSILELAASLAEPDCDHLASCKRIGPDWI